MKKRLLELIDQTNEIEKLFHGSSDYGRDFDIDIIYDVQEFQIWRQGVKCELQEIYDRTHDRFIWSSLNDMTDVDFNGWKDRRSFNKVKGNLLAIKGRIDVYYPRGKQSLQSQTQEMETTDKGDMKMEKRPKIFISHSSKDREYIEKIIGLLDGMGLDETQLFCSSMPGYDIPATCHNIIDYLWELFHGFNLHIIYVHSKNYYNSVYCMNEMGAAWVLKNEFTSFLLPGFDFDDMRGVIDKHGVAIKLDRDEIELKDKLNELYEQVIQEFSLRKKSSIIWEQRRDAFIKSINEKLSVNVSGAYCLTEEAEVLLRYATEMEQGVINKYTQYPGGRLIQVGNQCFSESQGIREFSKWDDAIDELLKCDYIRPVNDKKTIFQVTNSGFKYIELKLK